MDTFVVTIFVLGFTAVMFFAGVSSQKGDTVYDCKHYGKTQINGKWYECKVKEEGK